MITSRGNRWCPPADVSRVPRLRHGDSPAAWCGGPGWTRGHLTQVPQFGGTGAGSAIALVPCDLCAPAHLLAQSERSVRSRFWARVSTRHLGEQPARPGWRPVLDADYPNAEAERVRRRPNRRSHRDGGDGKHHLQAVGLAEALREASAAAQSLLHNGCYRSSYANPVSDCLSPEEARHRWTERRGTRRAGGDAVARSGCDNCSRMAMAKRRKAMGSDRYQNDGDPRTSGPGFALTLHRSALEQPYRWAGRRTVFVDSMSDLFHAKVPLSYLRDVFTGHCRRLSPLHQCLRSLRLARSGQPDGHPFGWA